MVNIFILNIIFLIKTVPFLYNISIICFLPFLNYKNYSYIFQEFKNILQNRREARLSKSVNFKNELYNIFVDRCVFNIS